jgi:hypothetical protein
VTQAPAPMKGNMHAKILAILGVIAFIAGIAISTIRGTGLRGSGLGTLLIVVGVVLLIISYLRFTRKI